MLLKGLGDVQVAPDPQEAATMALLRLIHAADLPDPAELIARWSAEGKGAAPQVGAAPQTVRGHLAIEPADGFQVAGQAAGRRRESITLPSSSTIRSA